MSQVRYHPLGPLLSGEGSRAFLGLALEAGAAPRPVVLVWAPPEVARDSELSAQLERETQRAAVLEHPNILRVHGMVSLDAGLARVTEFADGESLRRVLEVRPRIPPAFAALIVSDVAMGVHYAHMAGNDDGTPLVHGDLRPETVMVSFNGVCKVTGYGALNVAPRERNGRRVRNRRNYSAPEQLMGGREAVTARTDVFLLGLLLHECLTGRMPFQDAPDSDQAVLTRQLPPLPADIPRPLAEVVRRAAAKRANERYATVLEFREAVVAAIEGLPSAETFSEFLAQLFPVDRDARATRRQMLEIGLADMTRRASLSGLPAAQPTSAPVAEPPPPATPTRPSGSVRPLTPLVAIDTIEEEVAFKDIPFDEDDANAVDSVLEITGRHTLPGVARPLAAREEPRAPSLSEEPVTPPLGPEARPAPVREEPPRKRAEVDDDEPVPPKRRSRVPLLVGTLAVAAAAGGFFLWKGRQQADPATASNAAPPVALSAPAKTQGPALAAPGDTGATSPASAQPVQGEAGTTATLATAPSTLAGDAGTPSAQGAAPAVAVAGGPTPSGPAGSVVPASGSAPAVPSASESTQTPEPQSAAVTTRLQLFVMPPVEVSLDGKRLGRTPLAVPLAPGPYTLELRNPAKGVRTTRAITVRPQGTTKQRILLGKGIVQVRAPAGSRIFLNGRKAGPKLSLYEGEHQLVVTTGKARWEKSFRLEARQRVTFDVAYENP
ncbi:serine/threonine-protein kinase [Vitiosangium sp. GDMCC 1.1324]|uniref:serine/threonine-protein kinase n=1 Tax=Vitiosangium sp. (strain GDMCC 1.1324) TaxID=2138576 RepID=UPI000D3A2C2D|nr:serine/threonine-protein kinase [Vitiosangium sp. GDMCC 1.1324]PTL85251.1 serine/threonine protein kinase [Vitiosangium sp. GDMCC 1.1324]